jgi:hydroxyethylthiazole kinase-like uncharacterized protein yjeF
MRQPLYSADQSRELDRRAIAAGTPGYTLMQRAGQAAFQWLREHWPNATRIVVLVGRGNNGGDGYVLARLAWSQNLDVHLLTVGDHEQLKGEAIEAASDATRACVPEFSWTGALPEADIYVDALFGTGLTRPPSGDFPAAIAALNASGKPVLAIDIPSGLAADTGHAPGAVVEATATITFIGMKAGLLTGAALLSVAACIWIRWTYPPRWPTASRRWLTAYHPNNWLAGYRTVHVMPIRAIMVMF